MSETLDRRVCGAVFLLDAATRGLLNFFDTLPAVVTTDPLVGGWTPAGHLWHLALTHDVFSGVLRGDGPVRSELGTSDCTDDQWSFNAPPSGPAPAVLVPPSDIAAAAAQQRLQESVARLRPLIEELNVKTAIETVQLPWGRVSVCQTGEWAGGHTLRHLSQVGRELHRSALRDSVSV